ncbi:hypothetical protein CXG81DRAFT_23046 [Caulochytrium protostelioides]|uniref:UDENN domain-containing protein n=1 Tax=Caulochytrium protostelioides TaxID=1555241 RepID=A0A4P9XGG5_9FUNG|nr:hypothetical protein CXG81DRAFT_23046 [Caulochytrium protostelioides]|eukprot:RKP04270.1 hypothetical protein CXG81DRAFT_23046 [Caulochytrium protostelioides]
MPAGGDEDAGWATWPAAMPAAEPAAAAAAVDARAVSAAPPAVGTSPPRPPRLPAAVEHIAEGDLSTGTRTLLTVRAAGPPPDATCSPNTHGAPLPLPGLPPPPPPSRPDLPDCGPSATTTPDADADARADAVAGGAHAAIMTSETDFGDVQSRITLRASPAAARRFAPAALGYAAAAAAAATAAVARTARAASSPTAGAPPSASPGARGSPRGGPPPDSPDRSQADLSARGLAGSVLGLLNGDGARRTDAPRPPTSTSAAAGGAPAMATCASAGGRAREVGSDSRASAAPGCKTGDYPKQPTAPMPPQDFGYFWRWIFGICVVNFDLELGQAIEHTFPDDLGLSDAERRTIAFTAFPDSNSIGHTGDSVFDFRIKSSEAASKLYTPQSAHHQHHPPHPPSAGGPLERGASRDQLASTGPAAREPWEGRSAGSPRSPASATLTVTTPTFAAAVPLAYRGAAQATSTTAASATASAASTALTFSSLRTSRTTTTAATALPTPDGGEAKPRWFPYTQLALPAGCHVDSDGHLYAYVFFRQIQDPSNRRGFFQKSLVLLTPHPWPALFLELIYRFGVHYMHFYSNAPGIPAIRNGPDAATYFNQMFARLKDEVSSWPAPPSAASPHSSYASIPLALPFFHLKLHYSFPPHAHFPQSFDKPISFSAHSRPPSPGSQTATTATRLKPCCPARIFQLFQRCPEVLWTLWELVLLGEPVLVLADTPGGCSQVVHALVELVKPLPFGGDYRPYFTIQDADIKTLASRHRAPSAAVLLGVTNPVFSKLLEHWPHVLRVGRAFRSADGPGGMGGATSSAAGADAHATLAAQAGVSYSPKPPKKLGLASLLASPSSSAAVSSVASRLHGATGSYAHLGLAGIASADGGLAHLRTPRPLELVDGAAPGSDSPPRAMALPAPVPLPAPLPTPLATLLPAASTDAPPSAGGGYPSAPLSASSPPAALLSTPLPPMERTLSAGGTLRPVGAAAAASGGGGGGGAPSEERRAAWPELKYEALVGATGGVPAAGGVASFTASSGPSDPEPALLFRPFADATALTRGFEDSVVDTHVLTLTTKHKPFVSKDRKLLKEVIEASIRGKPTYTLNNALRRHFMELTDRFLQPLNRFLVEGITSRQPHADRLDELTRRPDIRPFRQDAFLQSIEGASQLPVLPVGYKRNGVALYKRFLKSPHFGAWLQHRTAEINRAWHHQYLDALGRADMAAWATAKAARGHHIELIDLMLRVRDDLQAYAPYFRVDPATGAVSSRHDDVATPTAPSFTATTAAAVVGEAAAVAGHDALAGGRGDAADAAVCPTDEATEADAASEAATTAASARTSVKSASAAAASVAMDAMGGCLPTVAQFRTLQAQYAVLRAALPPDLQPSNPHP